MSAAADAELRGEPETALRHYESIRMFSDSLHHQRLLQLVELGDDAPAWLWSRWLTVQARRPVWTGSRSAQPDPTIRKALEVAYPHGVETAAMEDFSTDVFLVTLYERDWVLRQLVVYEEGALRELVDNLAAPRLLDRADQVRDWVDAPMGGYRFDADEGGQLQLTDLGNGRRVDAVDLGVAGEFPGTCLLGRLVPTVEPPGRMFEWMPLAVDEGTARMVAERPLAWLDIVAERARDETLPIMFSYVGDTAMVADLPERIWLGLFEPDEIRDLSQTDGLLDYRDVALVAVGKLLRFAKHRGTELGAGRAVAECLLLEPGLWEAMQSRYGGRRFAYAWWVLAGLVREPARSRCLRMAETRAA